MSAISAIKKRLGHNINIGDHVVYFKNGNVAESLHNHVKKYIFKVVIKNDYDKVKLQNIATKSYFEVYCDELVNITIYIALNILNEAYISKACLMVYKSKDYDDDLSQEEPWDDYDAFAEKYLTPASNVGDDDDDQALHITKKYVTLASNVGDDNQALHISGKYVALASNVGDDDQALHITKSKQTKGKIMNSIKTDRIISTNVSAAQQAAKITAGKTLNRVVREKVTPMLPILLRSYAGTKVGEVVIANLFSFAVDNFAATNKNAKLAADAMMQASMQDLFATFNVDEILSEIMSNVNLDSLTETTS